MPTVPQAPVDALSSCGHMVDGVSRSLSYGDAWEGSCKIPVGLPRDSVQELRSPLAGETSHTFIDAATPWAAYCAGSGGDRGPPDGSTKVFVGGLSLDTTTDMLGDHFSRVGEVVFCIVFADRETGRSRGSGKVDYASPEVARVAVETLNNTEFNGRFIAVRPFGVLPPRRGLDGASNGTVGTGRMGGSEARKGLEVSSLPSPAPGDRPESYARVLLESGFSWDVTTKAVAECFHLPDSRGCVGGEVFVGGLSWDTDSERLSDHFGQAGEVVHAQVFADRETGRSRGAGKVRFATAEAARRAVERLHASELDGRTVTVKIMEERGPPRGPLPARRGRPPPPVASPPANGGAEEVAATPPPRQPPPSTSPPGGGGGSCGAPVLGVANGATPPPSGWGRTLLLPTDDDECPGAGPGGGGRFGGPPPRSGGFRSRPMTASDSMDCGADPATDCPTDF